MSFGFHPWEKVIPILQVGNRWQGLLASSPGGELVVRVDQPGLGQPTTEDWRRVEETDPASRVGLDGNAVLHFGDDNVESFGRSTSTIRRLTGGTLDLATITALADRGGIDVRAIPFGFDGSGLSRVLAIVNRLAAADVSDTVETVADVTLSTTAQQIVGADTGRRLVRIKNVSAEPARIGDATNVATGRGHRLAGGEEVAIWTRGAVHGIREGGVDAIVSVLVEAY